jgi:hypothetical protein
MTSFKHLFTPTSLIDISPPTPIVVGDDSTIFGIASGTVVLPLANGSTMSLSNVLYVPDLGQNLLSVSALSKHGVTCSFSPEGQTISYHGTLITNAAPSANGLWILDTTVAPPPDSTTCDFPAISTNVTADSDDPSPSFALSSHISGTAHSTMCLWHRRFGHIGWQLLRLMRNRNIVSGLSFVASGAIGACVVCDLARSTRGSHPRHNRDPSPSVLVLIHSDTFGPIRTTGYDGNQWGHLFLDDCTGFITVGLSSTKAHFIDAFADYKAHVETLHGCSIRRFRSDNAGESSSANFMDLLQSHGIANERIVAGSPEQNGAAERSIGTIVTKARALMLDCDLPTNLWPLAINHAVLIQNLSPCDRLGNRLTPWEAWYGTKPDVSFLKVFGCPAVINHPASVVRPKSGKTDPKFGARGRRTIYVGRANGRAADLFYCFKDKKVYPSDAAKFDEFDAASLDVDETPPDQPTPGSPLDLGRPKSPSADPADVISLADDATAPAAHNLALPLPNPAPPIPAPDTSGSPPPISALRLAALSAAPPKPPKQCNDPMPHVAPIEPDTFAQALSSPERSLWIDAMTSEIQSLVRQRTWTVTHLPPGRKTISAKWVYTIKHAADGTISRYKARLVARGFLQKQGIDYDSTFAPVIRMATLRALLATAAALDFEIHQTDISVAFLQGDLDETIYMAQPLGFVDDVLTATPPPDDLPPPTFDPTAPRSSLALRLQRPIYGLTQSARMWSIKFTGFFIDQGFTQSDNDPCLYVRYLPDSSIDMAVGVWVDDCCITGRSAAVIANFKTELGKTFTFTDGGPISYFVGLQIQRDRPNRRLHIHQGTYIRNLLAQQGLSSCTYVATPLVPGSHLSTSMCPDSDAARSEMTLIPYRKVIGTLIYASVATRPDIAYAVSEVARFMSDPGPLHWRAVKHLLRYLAGTPDLGLTYGCSPGHRDTDPILLQAYTDADWAGDIDRRLSTTGYVFLLYDAPISWRSCRQRTVALSSMESEYMSLSAAAQEAITIGRLMIDLRITVSRPVPIRIDNQAAIAFADDPTNPSRARHIDIRRHYARDAVAARIICVKFCPTEFMIADIFTKALPKPLFQRLRTLLGLQFFDSSGSGRLSE